jgi:putative oxidoreductase
MDISLLVLHALVGLLFVGHGAQKLFGVLGGHGLDGTGGFMEALGLRPGRLHAIAGGTAEVVGGALLALGLLLPLGAALVTAVMTTAIITVHFEKGVWNSDGGFEYNAVLIAVALLLAAVGGGEYALDTALELDLTGTAWGLGAVGAGLLGGIAAVISGRLAGAGHGGRAQTAGG